MSSPDESHIPNEVLSNSAFWDWYKGYDEDWESTYSGKILDMLEAYTAGMKHLLSVVENISL